MNFGGIHEDGRATYVAGGDLSAGTFVKFSSEKVVACTAATDEAIGVTLTDALEDEEVAVKLLGVGGTVGIVAKGVIAQGEQVTPEGKAAAVSTDKIVGRALNAAAASGDVVELASCVVRTTIAPAG